MAQRVDLISALTIRELTGLKRQLVLRGGGLPFKGAPWPIQQRVVTTWYPGNSAQATQHVLGPVDKPSTWQGFWKTTQLVDTPAEFSDASGAVLRIVVAFELVRVFEDIIRGGQALSVEWSDNTREQGRKIVREGVGSDFEPKYHRADDIEWQITWDWSGRGVQQEHVTFRNTSVLEGVTSTIVTGEQFAQLPQRFSLDNLFQFVDSVLFFTNGIARKMQQVVSRLKDVGDLILAVRSIPFQIAGQADDLATNTIAVANQFVDEISRKAPEQLSKSQKASQLTAVLSFYSTGIRESQLTARSARALRERLAQANKVQSDILAVHVVRQTESLVTLSLRYYGTPDQASSIAKANRLPLNQTTVDAGTILIIPRIDQRTTGDLSAARRASGGP